MEIKKFEDIIAWQKSQNLEVEIYTIFQTNKDFGFRDQICRAVLSISNNIAEGFERTSKKAFGRFLVIAPSSCSETRSMFFFALRLKYINEEIKIKLIEGTNEISRIIYGLINSLKSISSSNS